MFYQFQLFTTFNEFPLTGYFLVLLCRSGRGRKLSGDQITLPTTVDFSSSVPKQVSIASINCTPGVQRLAKQITELIIAQNFLPIN